VSRGGGTKTTTTTSVSKRKFGQPEEEEEVLETSDVEVGFASEGGAFRSQKSCKMTGFGAKVVLAPEKVRLQELGSGKMAGTGSGTGSRRGERKGTREESRLSTWHEQERRRIF
jgi:hypothetical protein